MEQARELRLVAIRRLAEKNKPESSESALAKNSSDADQHAISRPIVKRTDHGTDRPPPQSPHDEVSDRVARMVSSVSPSARFASATLATTSQTTSARFASATLATTSQTIVGGSATVENRMDMEIRSAASGYVAIACGECHMAMIDASGQLFTSA
eukprot:SAG31_NODE_13382_length_873_cov_1.397933_1_plen_154_part_10